MKTTIQKAVITGCSSGIGLGIASSLLEQGTEVWGISRSEPPSLTAHSRFHWERCDLLDPSAADRTMESVFAAMQQVDLLINNAGSGLFGTLDSCRPEDIENLCRLLITAPLKWTQAFCRQTRDPDSGTVTERKHIVVTVSSLAAELPIPLMPIYNAAKAAVSAATLSLDLDRAHYPNIRFIDFRPGDFRTDFAVKMFASDPDTGARFAAFRDIFLRQHDVAPPPEKAVSDLLAAIDRGRSGTIRSGTFFQARLAPLGVRLLPRALMRRLILAYYKQPHR